MKYSGYTLKNGIKLFYEVFVDGFDIYFGENAKRPTYHQPEPYIPNPDISYEENAIQMCKEISETSNNQPDQPFNMTETMYNNLTTANEMMRADLDYLLLLSE